MISHISAVINMIKIIMQKTHRQKYLIINISILYMSPTWFNLVERLIASD